MKKEFVKKLEERKDKNYFVNFEVKSTIIRASIKLTESVTNNVVYAECYPNYTGVTYIKVDGVEYQVDVYVGSKFSDGQDFWNTETNRRVMSKEKKEYLKEVANSIIRKGNEYLRNTFGNVDKEIVEIF